MNLVSAAEIVPVASHPRSPKLTHLIWQLFIALISIKAEITFHQGCWLALSDLSCGKVSSDTTDAL